MLDYQLTLRYLAYLGFEGDTTTAIKVTRPRKIDRRKGKVQRNVFLCYVFGAPRSGKVFKALFVVLGEKQLIPPPAFDY